MTSDGANVCSPKGQGIVKGPSTSKTPHLSAPRSIKSPGQRNLDVDNGTDTSTRFRAASSSPDTTQPEKDPVKAYLRIRPLPSAQTQPSSSYLKVLDNQHVSLIPPEDSNAYRKRPGASDQYQFTKVFTDNTNQQQFFEETTLPLLQTFIHGNNALIFAYGVTNSGKTYSMLGNTLDAGIVPRTIHILFDNLQDRLSHAQLKPVMHSSIQSYDLNHGSELDDKHENRSLLLNVLDTPHYDIPSDNKNVLDVDARFEYGIWVSFAEIYNEKVYDLLESPDNKKEKKRSALPLKYEYRTGYKYIAGLKHVRVKSAKEAYAVIHQGQQNRVVFSTLMNQSSSRSHSVFTISLIRCSIDKENYVIEDPAYATMSKMSIVDLAGSERYRNTLNQGQRLKEAGNINKSLMVLGQCMETLRTNQIKLESGKRPSMVPFRQSKLTELFKNTFEGDGQVAIVVNVNPFDTGFDENSHVMKFAAIAKEVTTVQQQKKVAVDEISDTVRKRRRRNTTDSNSDSETATSNLDCGEHHSIASIKELLKEVEPICDDLRKSVGQSSTDFCDFEQRINLQNYEMEKILKVFDVYQQNASDFEAEINAHIEAIGNSEDGEEPNNREILLSLKSHQQFATSTEEIFTLLKEHTKQQHVVLNDVLRYIENVKSSKILGKTLQVITGELKSIVNRYGNDPSLPTVPLSTQSTLSRHQANSDKMAENNSKERNRDDHQYANFLELRKQLRRSVFKRDDLLADTEHILYEIEHFENVTFDLVKNTKMGKLLKLITQEEFKNDPFKIQQRALVLFKRFARLPQSTSSQEQQRQQKSLDSPVNSIECNSTTDSSDHGQQGTQAENLLLNDFGDDNDFDDDNDSEGDDGGTHTKTSETESPLTLEKRINYSSDKWNAYEAIVAGDGVDDTLFTSAHDEQPPTRKRRKLRSRI